MTVPMFASTPKCYYCGKELPKDEKLKERIKPGKGVYWCEECQKNQPFKEPIYKYPNMTVPWKWE